MKNTVLRPLAAALLMLPLVACSAASGGDSPDKVKKAFQERFPERKVVSVKTTPIPSLFEVVVKVSQGGRDGYSVVYSDARADYIVVGDLIDAKKRESLTEARAEELNKVTVSFATLPLDKAIKEVRGDGSRKLVVFSDPDCPFCKRLETTLKDVNNVTVYTFLYPLSELHPDAPRKSQAIWCSADRAKTWSSFMRDGTALPAKTDCETPLAEIQQLGNKLGIRGTPALIFANGDLVSGAIPKEEIEKRLSAK